MKFPPFSRRTSVPLRAWCQVATRRLQHGWLHALRPSPSPDQRAHQTARPTRHPTQHGMAHLSRVASMRLLAKAVLLSFWFAADAIALIALIAIPASDLVRQAPLLAVVIAVLAAGTLCALMLTPSGGWGVLRRSPVLAAGLIVALSVSASGATVLYANRQHALLVQTGRADPGTAARCREVAALEHKLFRADAGIVLAQCLIQYDRAYAAVRAAAIAR